jgi:uncharacterized Zn finger protein
MLSLKCPACSESIDLDDDIFEGDIAECASCGAFLEIQIKDNGWDLINLGIRSIEELEPFWVDEKETLEDIWVEEVELDEEEDW